MADYLQQLGWQVEPDPIETLDLQLPQTLGDTWGDYAAMQTEQGLPFADFAGQPIRRYTFRITNYPGMDGGVQALLHLAEAVQSPVQQFEQNGLDHQTDDQQQKGK
ncbi:DUF4830 domain-containing protein [Evtepia gabavorous]|uniref:DUF4830 domain-containing protein n=1 Tax=Evtepia gabavorous TaxID=2211183 RepID=UPI003A91A309